MTSEFKDFPVTVEVALAWGEMDFFRHVNNIVYFRYFENARIKYFDKIGLSHVEMKMAVGPILAKTSCKFIFPLTYPDTVTVGVRTSKLLPERLTHEYKIFSQTHKKVAALGEGEIVAFDYQLGKKSQFPESILKAIKSLEGNAL